MNFYRPSLGLFAIPLLFSVSIGVAQETPAPVAQPAPLPAVQAVEPQVKSTQYADWTLRCIDVKAEGGSIVPSCEVAQVSQVKQGDKDVNVLTLSFAKAAPDPAQKDKTQGAILFVTALVPLNIFLPAGFTLDADGKTVTEMVYRNCNDAGCWVQQKTDAKVVAALQKGTDGGARVRLMNGQNINIKFSLKGLTEALNALQK
jgi:invasion protein IalB